MQRHLAITSMLIIVALIGACSGSTTPTTAPTGASATATPAGASATPGGETAEPTGAEPTGAEPTADAGAIPEQGVDDGTALTMWSRAATEVRLQSQVDAYNETHQNQVELRLVPTDDYVATVATAAGANELPDLFSADVVFMPNWTSQGLFTDLTDRIDALPGIENVGPAHIVASSWEGKKYGLPLIIDLSVWMYNKQLFTDAGLDPEDPPGNLTEFADAARAIQALDREDVYGTYFGGNCGGCNVFTWWPISWAEGEPIMNPEGTEAFLNSETMQEIYTTFGALWDEGVIHPNSIQEPGDTWTNYFPQGQIGIMPMPASLQETDQMPLDNLGVTTIAGTTGGESTFVGGDSVGVSKDSQNVDAAWNFMTWMLGDYNQVEVVAQAGNVVSRTDLADNEYSAADPRLVLFNEVAGVGETPFALYFNDAYNSPQSPWIQLFRAAVFEDADAAEIDELNSQITSILAGN